MSNDLIQSITHNIISLEEILNEIEIEANHWGELPTPTLKYVYKDITTAQTALESARTYLLTENEGE